MVNSFYSHFDLKFVPKRCVCGCRSSWSIRNHLRGMRCTGSDAAQKDLNAHRNPKLQNDVS